MTQNTNMGLEIIRHEAEGMNVEGKSRNVTSKQKHMQ